MSSVYSIAPEHVERDAPQLLQACRRQGIERLTLLASVTGKLTATPQRLAACRDRLESAGLHVSAMVFAIGHPDMGSFYDSDGRPPQPARHYTGPRVLETRSDHRLLPAAWQYAVNEFGNPIYCTACANDQWLADNQRIAGELAAIFDQIWYDDEYRLDGDQGAGSPHRSTASCYCDACLKRLASRVGRQVTREQIISDPKLHEAWIDDKCDRLTRGFEQIAQAARAVRPDVSVGLMVRWGGEERDGIDIDRLRPHLGEVPRLRAGEGHFGDVEYAKPQSQVMEYLACSYHVSWFPQETDVLSETTYFAPMPRHSILKKAALAIAAGAGELAYCPCVDGFVNYQWFIEHDQQFLEQCAAGFVDKAALYQPIRIVRGPAAGRGDHRPAQRVLDRQYFPWFGQAGLNCTVVRQGSWRDTGRGPLAITGRSAWDLSPADAGDQPLLIDATALLEQAPLNEMLGITEVRDAGGGCIEVVGPFEPDGLLLRRGRTWIIPYVWHALPPEKLPQLLRELRLSLGPVTGSAYIDGDLDVLTTHHRYADYDSLMLVNLTNQTRRVTLRLPADRAKPATWDGRAVDSALILGPHEITVLRVTT